MSDTTEQTEQEWTEFEWEGHRIRYRPHPSRPGYEVEYWHVASQQWRLVRSGSSRDWFAAGVQAGREMERKENP